MIQITLKNNGFLLLHVVNSPIIESTLGKDTDIEVYDMPLARYNGKEYSFINAAFSKTEIPYLVIIIMLILGTFYL